MTNFPNLLSPEEETKREITKGKVSSNFNLTKESKPKQVEIKKKQEEIKEKLEKPKI